MSRSKWKGPHVDSTSLIKLNEINELKVMSRNSEILPNFIGKTFMIHNGNSFVSVLITEEMIGHKFGEFAFTRKIYTFKKKSNKN